MPCACFRALRPTMHRDLFCSRADAKGEWSSLASVVRKLLDQLFAAVPRLLVEDQAPPLPSSITAEPP